MLVLRRKERERIVIEVAGQRIVVTVTAIERGAVKIGFECPKTVHIMREELFLKDGGVIDDVRPREG